MYHIRLFLISTILILIGHSLYAQISMKRDDFVGTNLRNWWTILRDPSPSLTPSPTYKNGYISFKLINPTSYANPWYDCEIYDGYPVPGGPWQNVSITVRLRTLNDHRLGSNGWGLWYTEWPVVIQNQILFMRDLDSPSYTGIDWFRADIWGGPCPEDHSFTELDDEIPPDIDEREWHTYRIIRDDTTNNVPFVKMLVDGNIVLYTTQHVPDHPMAFHIWIDNMIYDPQDDCTLPYYRRGWRGQSEMVLDYVQILQSGKVLGSTEISEGIKLLRAKPREIFAGTSQSLWKQYQFDSPFPGGGNVIFLLTARAERYVHDELGEISNPDAIRLVIDGNDYSWTGPTAINGAAGTVSKTLLIEQVMDAGSKSIEIYGDISPLLHDVTAIGSSSGGIVYDQVYNETAPGGDDYLWKDIDFLTHAGEVAIYVSGTADEDPTPTRYGYDYSDYGSSEDDELRIVLDGNNYGYQNENALWGNRLFGEPKSILIIENLSQGPHNLKIYSNNTPTLYRIVIYGENDDNPLPITLSEFHVNIMSNSNIITWRTESEVNNLGFNIYKATSEELIPVSELDFHKINPRLIAGAGSSTKSHEYFYEDFIVQNNRYYWYQLEDVDVNGNVKAHEVFKIFRNENDIGSFKLYQNYPNPFNGITQFKFELKEKSPVKMTIYSVEGRIVSQQDLGVFEKGSHKITWDAESQDQSLLPSGVYYLQLVTNYQQNSLKMVLIR